MIEDLKNEDIINQVGGRFKLTALIQKQARGYYLGGRAFMPSVRNLDELFAYILDEIEDDKITLLVEGPPEEADEVFAPPKADETEGE